MAPLIIVNGAFCKQAQSENKDAFSLFKAGEALLPIILPAQGEPEEEQAANELAAVLKKMSGATFTIREEGAAGEEVGIFIGTTASISHIGTELKELDRDGFIIHSEGKKLILRGATPRATLNAVYWFLQKYGGVRWYVPGELGEHIPSRREWILRPIDEHVEPHFISRHLTGIVSKEQSWKDRNLLGQRYQSTHNLHRIFSYTLFKDHPEWFPLVNGTRFKPPAKLTNISWQPNLALPEVAEHAAAEVARIFSENQDWESLSLGINDVVRFDESEATLSLITPLKFFRERPDYSDLVFKFMNRVAHLLGKDYPEKYLTCLAYFWVENTPSFPVHPKVIPFLTADRSQWYDLDFKEQDKELIKRWCASGPEIIGLYDYYYGGKFAIPRVFPNSIGESLSFAYKAGVRVFFGELNPNWALDGPKAWLAAQLLWDSEQSIDALLNDYYGNYFKETAPYMRQFFERCEDIWTHQKGPARWIKFYRDPAQATLFPPQVCVELQGYLDEAHRAAESSLVRERVTLVAQGFRLTALFSAYYNQQLFLSRSSLTEKDSIGAFLEALPAYLEARREFKSYLVALRSMHPLHSTLPDYSYLFDNDPLPRLVAQAILWAQENHQRTVTRKRLKKLFRKEDGSEWRRISKSRYGQSAELLIDGGLEDPEVVGFEVEAKDQSFITRKPRSVNGWIFNYRPTEFLAVKRSADYSRNGKSGLRFSGSSFSTLYQSFDARPKKFYYISAWFKGQVSAASKVQVGIFWQDKTGRSLLPSRRDRLPPGHYTEWFQLGMAAEAPTGAVKGFIYFRVLHQEAGDFIWIDDLSARELN